MGARHLVRFLSLAAGFLSLVVFGAAAMWSVPRGLGAARLVAATNDPVALSELALSRSFDAQRARTEISSALEEGDAELAQSLLDLAAERAIAVPDHLAARVRAANAPDMARDLARAARSAAHGLVTGAPGDGYGLAGAALGDLFVFGDVRDATRETTRWARGEAVDGTLLTLSMAGLALTAGTYASAGAAAPARVGLSLAKVAGRTGRLSAPLMRAVRLERAEGVLRLAGDVGRVQAKAGTRAALEGLRVVERPADAARLARLAEAKGGKTRAIVKLLGRGAIVLTSALAELALWMLWAAANLLALCAALKRGVERMTLSVLRRRRRRRLARAAAQSAAGAAAAGAPVPL